MGVFAVGPVVDLGRKMQSARLAVSGGGLHEVQLLSEAMLCASMDEARCVGLQSACMGGQPLYT